MTGTGAEIFSQIFNDPPDIFQVTETDGAAYCPVWSPDLSYIAYQYYEPATDTTNIWLIDMLNDAVSLPATEVGVNIVGNLSWSADSLSIVWNGSQPNGAEMDVYRLDIQTGDITNLTKDSPFWDASPAWSPVDNVIAFVSDRYEAGGEKIDNIWVMAPDGSNPQNLTNSELWENTDPAWSPDGELIAFFRHGIFAELAGDEGGPPGLWVMNADGSEQHVLVEIESFVGFGIDPPAWSPDGRFIAYLAGPPDDRAVYIVPSEGGEPILISDMEGNESEISWSSDSEQITFTLRTEDDFQLYIAAADGSLVASLFEYSGNGCSDWMPGLR